ncbi:MAG: hypothetical protein IZT59_03125 [Verrucomicrobia bacterium]|nr:hypothetical protein [Verrucomicrobiota bacterium]
MTLLAFAFVFVFAIKAKTDTENESPQEIRRRLSPTSSFSCNACHDLEKYGTNDARYTTQREAEKTYRDVPSLYNLKSSELFNWDGHYTSLEARPPQRSLARMK